MMNMHGAVMAADKDQTIFRYSDKVPFALMTDPKSKLPWADIWNEFRINTNLQECNLDKLEKYLKKKLPEYKDVFSREIVFCVYYKLEEIFPITHNMEIRMVNNKVEVKRDASSCNISPNNEISYVNWLGDFSHMGTMLGDSIIETGDVAKEVFKELVVKFKANAFAAAKEGIDKSKLELLLDDAEFGFLLDNLLDISQRKLKGKLDTAINSYHIEDMVRMSEKLVDAEAQLQHLQEPQKPLTVTREIAIMTLAEGFKWIKHSLYGA